MKTNFTQQQLDQIIELYNQELGSRKIAEIMGFNRSTIQRAYKQLNLDSKSKKTPRYAYKATEKQCKKCEAVKDVDQFRKRIKGTRTSYEVYCLSCEKEYCKESNKKRYREKWDQRKEYRIKNKDKIAYYNKKYQFFNKDILKNKRILSRDRYSERLKKYYKEKRKNDINYRFRLNISSSIRYYLNLNGGSKNGKSCTKYLPYTIQELKDHLENQFEPWMNWNNWGLYKLNSWNDNDSSTWTWQIDHIIPQSNLPYKTMHDENFKKCWSLTNLRPLSAKQNLLDGINRTRHIVQ